MSKASRPIPVRSAATPGRGQCRARLWNNTSTDGRKGFSAGSREYLSLPSGVTVRWSSVPATYTLPGSGRSPSHGRVDRQRAALVQPLMWTACRRLLGNWGPPWRRHPCEPLRTARPAISNGLTEIAGIRRQLKCRQIFQPIFEHSVKQTSPIAVVALLERFQRAIRPQSPFPVQRRNDRRVARRDTRSISLE